MNAIDIKKVLIVIVISILPTICFATSQDVDRLIWNNDTLVMFSNPLDKYCDSCNIGYLIQDKLRTKDSLLYPGKYLNEHEELSSSICSRGYFAEWILIKDKLYLNKIRACHDSNLTLSVKEVFQGNNEKLYADWYSGEIILPKGECLGYDYYAIYKEEVVLKFSTGLLVNSTTYKNSIVKKSSFFYNYYTKESQQFIYGNIQWNKFPKFHGKTITAFVCVQPNKNGQIDSIQTKYTYAINDKGMITDLDNIYIKEAIRIAKTLPEWDVVYQRGNIVSITITIYFNNIMKNKYAHQLKNNSNEAKKQKRKELLL